MHRPPLTASGLGCSSAALLDYAPEYDEENEPIEGRMKEVHRPLTPAKLSDEIKPAMCPRCGLVPRFVAKHKKAAHCILELRMKIGSMAYTGPPVRNPGGKGKRAVAAG